MGTPFYLAPELLFAETRQSYSVKSDVWALGVILYELCALRKPFLGNNEEQLYERIRDDDINHIPHLSKEMMDLLSVMLAKDRDVRPTVREILESDFIRKASCN